MPPKARAKLSTAKRAEATKKSRVTRCKNKCEESGGVKVKRSYASSAKRKEAVARAKVNLGPWRNFFAKYRVDHENDYPKEGRYRALQSAASKEWGTMSASKKAAFADEWKSD